MCGHSGIIKADFYTLQIWDLAIVSLHFIYLFIFLLAQLLARRKNATIFPQFKKLPEFLSEKVLKRLVPAAIQSESSSQYRFFDFHKYLMNLNALTMFKSH